MAGLLGLEVKDKITGFKGIVTGAVQYLDGENRSLVEGVATKNGECPHFWFDDKRLQIVKATRESKTSKGGR